MVDYEDDEIFRDINSFYKRLMERMFKEMQGFEEAVNRGRGKGGWKIAPINKPGIKGYVVRGQFHLGNRPMNISKQAPEEEREPLTDVFDETENVKVYMELPGVDKSDIQLNVTERFIEVKAGNFSKTVELPVENVDFDKAAATYKNGVLQVTVPKIPKVVEDERKRTIKIE